ncbi:MAG: SPFH domain-containing protein [Paludisphaera borealis]|uniref:SPFH domain-containing protein n=1 Tax=Paludisphaera borealis TaxID=1387353 RepID=UPI00284F9D3E|nr:SPFH domain-containing protein [Paludisphaera borealis]MDR3618529.1 SPFH domain-containing protein [Paludisphaera borealis]
MGSPLFVFVASHFVPSFNLANAALFADLSDVPAGLFWLVGLILALAVFCELLGLRYIANNRVGVVEKLWAPKGSVQEGRMMALNGEAGFQAELLRGGVHVGFWRWQYRIHKLPLVMVPQGKIGYVYARDGVPLAPVQTLGQVVDCNNFQDARAFLVGPAAAADPEQEPALGQRGRQRSILREGVYAVNLALFYVITEDMVYRLEVGGQHEFKTLVSWQRQLAEEFGFDPVVIGGSIETPDPLNPDRRVLVDSMGIVTVHDGPSLSTGEIIAPAVGSERNDKDHHNNYQDPEAFLRAGGRRGRQYATLIDGTYFINRWFATVESIPKTIVPIGYVGVIVSYYGRTGNDLSGQTFRHGERVSEGERGVQEKPLGPGKYAFNTYAGNIILVPTTNFVLHWVTGRTESHRYDESLKSIDLVTRDAYEPMLPLSVVVHIDYQKAPSVIQRFGDVKKLITQTLDPMLSAYFRDVAHKRTMLDLLQERDSIQHEAQDELSRKFHNFDIECVDVLIGKPDTAEAGGKIENLLEQLRLRQLSLEQMETYGKQVVAAEKLKALKEAQATAEMQTTLTNSLIQVRIVENEAEAQLARARKEAEQVVVRAEAESRRKILAGRGEGARLLQEGLSEASVLLRKIQSFTDPRLYALSVVAQNLAASTQPLVPERVFMAPGSGGSADGGAAVGTGLMGMLMSLLVAEKSGFDLASSPNGSGLQDFTDAIAKQAMENIQAAMATGGVDGVPSIEPAPSVDPIRSNGLVVETT